MIAYVIDTNVPVVANGRADQASPACVLNCLESLQAVQREGRVVLDDGMRILDEYIRNLNLSGQPGAGDYFMKWVWQNQGDSERCERVAIQLRDGTGDDFEEFPDDPRLDEFDQSDRKFVAAALASRGNPIVLNATDSDWWIFRAPRAEHGVQIEFLCPYRFGNE